MLKKKKLSLCVDKTKVMVFSRGNKEKKESWKWEDKELEEVQTFKYWVLCSIIKEIIRTI